MTASTLFAGASGYSFKEWKGSFYPATMKPDGMLAWYAELGPAIEACSPLTRGRYSSNV